MLEPGFLVKNDSGEVWYGSGWGKDLHKFRLQGTAELEANKAFQISQKHVQVFFGDIVVYEKKP